VLVLGDFFLERESRLSEVKTQPVKETQVRTPASALSNQVK